MSFGQTGSCFFTYFWTNKQQLIHLLRSCNTLKNSRKMSATATGSAAATSPRRLAAFDFDYTVVAQNSDTVVRDLLPPEKLTPPELGALIDGTGGWTAYMDAVFQLLYEQQRPNCREAQIRDTIRFIPEVPGFVRLLKWLRDTQNFDLIIISDSNSVFIAEWLQAHGLAECFAAVFTNPAHFDEDGRLHIAPYHHQTDCRLSAANLCKGRVLEKFVVEQDLRHNVRYECVVYVGDGNNDICPVLRLRVGDIACARRGFALEKQLLKNRAKMQLRAELLVWKTGFDLMEQLEVLLQQRRRRRSEVTDEDDGVAPFK